MDSRVEYLEAVPLHWKRQRLKTLVENVVERSGDQGTECFIALENVEGWTGVVSIDGQMDTHFDSQSKAFRSGDILFGKLRPYLAKVTRPARNGACVGEFLVLRPKGHEVAGRYFEHLLRSKPVIDAVDSSTFGARMPRADWQFVGSLVVGCPPVTEQTAIARFLDHMDRRVQKYIRAKEKLIALLEEYKQALIHQAVTGQIDVRTGEPYPEYKPSGAECFGNLPSHWQVVALRRRWSVTDCKHLTVPFVDCGVPLASVRQVQSFELDLGAANHTTREWFDVLTEGGRTPKVGDLIYCRNVSVGSAALVTTEQDIAMGQDVCLVRSKYENQRWLNYYLHSSVMTHQLKLVLVGSTFNRINVEDIKALLILVPPIAEQGGIASFLEEVDPNRWTGWQLI